MSGWGSAARGDRARRIAKRALDDGWVTPRQAREAVLLTRSLQKRGRRKSVEQVLRSKGYVSARQAKRLARHGGSSRRAEASLDLAGAKVRCPNCHRDPGGDEECLRCGADVASGLPGRHATMCRTCNYVVPLGTALCRRCGDSIAPRPPRARTPAYADVVEKLAVGVALLGGLYFLAYRPFLARPEATSDLAPLDSESALEFAERTLEDGDPQRALEVLEDALSAAKDAEERARLQHAIVFVAEAAGDLARSAEAAEAIYPSGGDPQLARILALAALTHEDWEAADAWLADLDEDAPTLYDRLGLGYHEQGVDALARGDTEAARASFEAAHEAAPWRVLPLYGLGIAAEREGDLSAAVKAYQRFCAEAASHPEHLGRVRKLQTKLQRWAAQH